MCSRLDLSVSRRLSLASSLRFLLPLYAGLFVRFSFLDVTDDAIFRALTLETSDRTI